MFDIRIDRREIDVAAKCEIERVAELVGQRHIVGCAQVRRALLDDEQPGRRHGPKIRRVHDAAEYGGDVAEVFVLGEDADLDAAPALEHAFVDEHADRPAQRVAVDAEVAREIALGRELVARAPHRADALAQDERDLPVDRRVVLVLAGHEGVRRQGVGRHAGQLD